MAKVMIGGGLLHEPVRKKTSIGGNASMIKTSSMNKHKRRGHKKYRGQGK